MQAQQLSQHDQARLASEDVDPIRLDRGFLGIDGALDLTGGHAARNVAQ